MSEQLLIVGCGNLLRGDDAVGPVLVRRLLELGLPPGVGVADAGTGGMDVAFRMRGVEMVILVDAARTGAEAGTIYSVPGSIVEQLPPLTGINLHAFRWDHALAFGRWLLKDEYPRSVQVYLIEGADFTIGAPLSPPVAARMEDLAHHLHHNPWQPYPGYARVVDNSSDHHGNVAA
jgi:hydrogenase maturation protease